MKQVRRICIIGLMIVVFMTGVAFARAGHVNTNGVRMRQAPSTEGEIITDLHNGNRVDILGESGDWFRIRFDNQEGYIRSDFVNVIGEAANEPNQETPVAPEPPAAPEVVEPESTEPEAPVEVVTFPQTLDIVIATSMRLIPSMSSIVLMELEEGTTITVNRQINNWSYVSYSNQSGWIRTFALEEHVSVPPADESNNNETTPEPNSAHRYVDASVVNIRQEPNTTSNILGTLARGVSVTVIGETNDWYRVEYGNIQGYILKSLLSDRPSPTTRGNEESRPGEISPVTRVGYVSVSVANIRTEPSIGSEINMTIHQNTEVNVLAEVDGFYRIEVNGAIGYVLNGLIVDSLD
ncbi:MAG: SH3 domain-containing protein [Oscillospiraceae bacterium]|nr:SH3 domain-containing protein [Oscillospiraceae bacterium]